MKANKTTRGWEASNHRRRKDKQSESSIHLTAHNQTYTGKTIKIRADLSIETLKTRRAWSEVFQALKENNFNPRILYPAKLSFKLERTIKVFHDNQKLKQYMTTRPPLQQILQEFCKQKIKANKTIKGQAVQNHRKRK
jgi:hypothetical protein